MSAMNRYFGTVFKRPNGQVAPLATVAVYETGTATPIDLYADSDGTQPLANPFTADANGYYAFYALPQRVDLQFSGTGIATPYTLPDVQPLTQVPAYATADLPPSSPLGIGRVALLTDGAKQAVIDNGEQWIGMGGGAALQVPPPTGGDDTAMIQAIINAAEAFDQPKPVQLQAGLYQISTITLTRSDLHGAGMGGAQSSATNAATLLQQIVGATDHMIKVAADASGSSSQLRRMKGIYDLALQGRREENLIKPCRIAAVTSRTSFSVNTSDLAQVTLANAGTGSFPYFGFCYFFSAENRYLGHGVVQTINTGTGAVTLASGWDNYATPTGSGSLPTTDMVVCFSQRYVGAVGNGRPDATQAGYCGISIADDVFGFVLERVAFEFLHAGIARGTLALVIKGTTLWFNNNTHGILRKEPNLGSDDQWDDLFIQGFYAKDPDLPAESGTFDNTQYRVQVAGLVYVGANDAFGRVTVDQSVNAVIDQQGDTWHIGYLFCDSPIKCGVMITDGSSLSLPDATIGHLAVDAPASLPTALTMPTGMTRAAVGHMDAGTGRGRRLSIATARISRRSTFPSSSDFPVFSSLVQANARLAIGTLQIATQGLTAPVTISADPSQRYPSIATIIGAAGQLLRGIPRASAADLATLTDVPLGASIYKTDVGPGWRWRDASGQWRSRAIVLDSFGNAITAPNDTNKNALVTVTVPGGLLGPNGTLVIYSLWSMDAPITANSKTCSIAVGGTQFLSADLANFATWGTTFRFSNRANEAFNIGQQGSNPNGLSTQFVLGTTIDTTVDFSVAFYAQKTLAAVAEVLKLQAYTIEIQQKP